MTRNEPIHSAGRVAYGDIGRSNEISIPDAIVPEQWSWGTRSLASLAPEAQLMVTVLDDAIFQLAALRGVGGDRAARERRELEAWFASPDASWLFSFESICATLNVDAAGIRAAVSRWKKETIGRRRTRKRRIRAQTGLTRVLGMTPGARDVA